MAADKKLTKVTFHYQDGTSKFIEGSELDKWSGFNYQVAVFAMVHKNNPDWTNITWTWTTDATIPDVPAPEPVNVKTAHD